MFKTANWLWGGPECRPNDEHFDLVITPREPIRTKTGAAVLYPQGVQTVWYYPDRPDPLPNWEPARTLTQHALDQNAMLLDRRGNLVQGWGGANMYAVDMGKLQAGVVMRAVGDFVDRTSWCHGVHFEDLHYNPASEWYDYVDDLMSWRSSFHRLVQGATRRIPVRMCNGFHAYYMPESYLPAFGINKLEGFLFNGFESDTCRRDHDAGQMLHWRHWAQSCRERASLLEGFPQPAWADDTRARYLRLGSATAALFDAYWLCWPRHDAGRYSLGAVWDPWYDRLLALGEPTDTFAVIPTRLFTREHEHGRLLVNPRFMSVSWRGTVVPALDAVIV